MPNYEKALVSNNTLHVSIDRIEKLMYIDFLKCNNSLLKYHSAVQFCFNIENIIFYPTREERHWPTRIEIGLFVVLFSCLLVWSHSPTAYGGLQGITTVITFNAHAINVDRN